MDVPAIYQHLHSTLPGCGAALFGLFPTPVAGEPAVLVAALVAGAASAPNAAPTPHDPGFHVRPEALLQVARTLRDDPALRFDFLQNLTAVDWIKLESIEIVYHLFSYQHRHEVVLKTSVARAQPRLASVSGLWNNANWLEREQYDLFGVIFEGHPDLRRLLLPDDWVGHPMRKDAREAAEYRGMPTTRPSTFDLLQAFDKAGAPIKAGS